MKKPQIIIFMVTLVMMVVIPSCATKPQPSVSMLPFGNPADLDFAAELWQQASKKNLLGNNSIKTSFYQGTHPHGEVLELIEQDLFEINKEQGALIIKKNYGGKTPEGTVVNIEQAQSDPNKYLKAITVMFQRAQNYDPENNNWFYVKFGPEGQVLTNKKGSKLAGKVAKGMNTGCIACHRAAPGGDFIFKHDRYVK